MVATRELDIVSLMPPEGGCVNFDQLLLKVNSGSKFVTQQNLRDMLKSSWRKDEINIFLHGPKFYYCRKGRAPSIGVPLKPLARPQDIKDCLPNTAFKIFESLNSAGYSVDVSHVIRELRIMEEDGEVEKQGKSDNSGLWVLMMNSKR